MTTTPPPEIVARRMITTEVRKMLQLAADRGADITGHPWLSQLVALLDPRWDAGDGPALTPTEARLALGYLLAGYEDRDYPPYTGPGTPIEGGNPLRDTIAEVREALGVDLEPHVDVLLAEAARAEADLITLAETARRGARDSKLETYLGRPPTPEEQRLADMPPPSAESDLTPERCGHTVQTGIDCELPLGHEDGFHRGPCSLDG